MRVLHFRRWFSALSETFVYDYVMELERQGLDNYFVCVERENWDSRPFGKVETLARPGKWSAVRIWDSVRSRILGRAAKEPLWRELEPAIRKHIARLSPDVIHAHFGWEGALIGPVARQCGVPLVVTFYGYDLSTLPADPWWRERYRRLWKEAAAITVLSRKMHEQVVDLGCASERAHVVHLGRDFRNIPRGRALHPVRRFVSVGRLVEKKGHLDAVKAFHSVCSRYPDARLEIIGDGILRPKLETLIDTLGISSRVKLAGALPNEETLERMAGADAFLLCSKTAPNGDQEGTPTVLIEAQLIGLPCVSTFHSGVPEMLPEENHKLLAPEGNTEAIGKCLESLLNCSEKTLGEIRSRGLNFIERNFNLTCEAGKLRSLYSTLSGHA